MSQKSLDGEIMSRFLGESCITTQELTDSFNYYSLGVFGINHCEGLTFCGPSANTSNWRRDGHPWKQQQRQETEIASCNFEPMAHHLAGLENSDKNVGKLPNLVFKRNTYHNDNIRYPTFKLKHNLRSEILRSEGTNTSHKSTRTREQRHSLCT